MALPAQLKPIQHHLRTAQEHEKRDPVVAYYCRLYAMQTGMKLDSKTPECRKFLIKLMDQLESMKKELSDNDSISQEVVGNAHVENYALKMFLYADNEDRAGRFHKNMIKSFYTSSLLLDVLSVFGELSEENIQHRKYARWKATYIHNCLKSGETPQAGPMAMGEEEADEFGAGPPTGDPSGETLPTRTRTTVWTRVLPRGSDSLRVRRRVHQEAPPPPPATTTTSTSHRGPTLRPTLRPSCLHPQKESNLCQCPRSAPAIDPALLDAPPPQGGVHLTAEDFTKAQKLCKYAGSALQYEDVGTAVQNLQKALKLLTTGKE